MMSTRSTSSLFKIGSPKARPLSVERVREEAFAMPIHGPVFGRFKFADADAHKAMTLPSCFPDRTALTVSYGTAVCVVQSPAPGTESSGDGLTDRPKLIEKFSRGQIGRLERSPKWSHSHAIF